MTEVQGSFTRSFHAEFTLLCRLHDPRRGKLGDDPRSKAVHARFSARKTRRGKLGKVVYAIEFTSAWKTARKPRVNESLDWCVGPSNQDTREGSVFIIIAGVHVNILSTLKRSL